MTTDKKPAPLMLVYLAFAIVYIVWGSTYFFIHEALLGFPPFILGSFRFIVAGLILMGWCKLNGQEIFNKHLIKHAAIAGILMLGIGNGIVIWVEQFIPSGLVAITVASAAIWFVILDKPNWKANFSNTSTVTGLIIGFVGVILLFSEQLIKILNTDQDPLLIFGIVLLVLGPASWAGGSLYAKRNAKPEDSVSVNTAWQMLAAGIAFLPGGFITSEFKTFNWSTIPLSAWMAIGYLILFGSIAAFSAYVWLLKHRPATQVSTYAYVNPVVAVILSASFTNEKTTLIQLLGLLVILASVLLINLAKYRKSTKIKTTCSGSPLKLKPEIE